MNSIGTLSYLSGGVLFLVLTLLLLTRWRGSLHSPYLALASGASAVWCLLLAAHAYAQFLPTQILLFAETLRNGAWLAFLLRLLGGRDANRLPIYVSTVTHLLWAAVAAFALWEAFAGHGTRSATIQGSGAVFSLLLLTLLGLTLIEQVYRNARQEQRWAIKYLCLGIGGLFAYDLYLYTQGLLLRQIDVNLWNARGAVNGLVVPLIALSMARTAQAPADLFVSRRLAFFTTSLTAAGLYLIAMALGGYYIRIYGGTWGTFAQVVFFFGAIVLLLSVLSSGQVRARLKVFLSKHFYEHKYDYREEWLRLIRTLSESGDERTLPQRTVAAVAQIVESPVGGVWIRREQHFVPLGGDMAGPDQPLEPVDSDFAQFLERKEWIINLDEYRNDTTDPELRVPQWLLAMERAWLILPLMHGTEMLGFMVLAQPRAPNELTWEDLDLLKTVGHQVASHLVQSEAARKLAQAEQFEAYNRLVAFIMHDLKNLIAQQSLVVKNASKHKHNAEFVEDAIATIENSVRRMNRLLEQLRRGEVDSAARRVSLARICREVVAANGAREPRPELQVGGENIVVYINPERLTLVIGHVIRNAQDSTPRDGCIRINVTEDGATAQITVEDTGCGMSRRFVRERLFRPFDTTKGSQGMGIGAYQVREFVQQAGGHVDVDSEPGRGTRFIISLPLSTAGQSATPALEGGYLADAEPKAIDC